jgi:hypothetical protein
MHICNLVLSPAFSPNACHWIISRNTHTHTLYTYMQYMLFGALTCFFTQRLSLNHRCCFMVVSISSSFILRRDVFMWVSIHVVCLYLIRISIYIYVCVYIYIYTYTLTLQTENYTNLHTHAYLNARIHTYTHTWAQGFITTAIQWINHTSHTCIHTYIKKTKKHISICIYTTTHIHTHRWR